MDEVNFPTSDVLLAVLVDRKAPSGLESTSFSRRTANVRIAQKEEGRNVLTLQAKTSDHLDDQNLDHLP